MKTILFLIAITLSSVAYSQESNKMLVDNVIDGKYYWRVTLENTDHGVIVRNYPEARNFVLFLSWCSRTYFESIDFFEPIHKQVNVTESILTPGLDNYLSKRRPYKRWNR